MAIQTQVIAFAKSTGANGTTQDVNLNFTPKAIILMSDGNTANNTTSAHFQHIQGFSDGTNHVCCCAVSEDAAAASDTGRITRNDSVYVRLSDTTPGTTTVATGTCVFATNKVTFTWVLNDAVATRITLWAFGGDDITNVKVNTVDIGRTTAGTQTYTGLGFTPVAPNAVAFFVSTVVGSVNVNTTSACISWGCGVSATKRWVISYFSEVADPSDTWRYQSDANCIMHYTTAAAAEAIADFDGWVSDGFQLDWTDPPSASAQKISYLVINGGTWDAGTLTSPAANTLNSDTAVSVNSKTLRGIMLGTTHLAAASLSAIQTVNTIAFGVSDSTPSQATIGMIDEDAQNTMDSYRVNNTVNILRGLTTNGADVTIATFDSFPTTAAFRLDYGTISTGTQIAWVVVADSAAAAAAVEDIFPHSFGTIQAFDNNIGPAIFGAGSEIGT